MGQKRVLTFSLFLQGNGMSLMDRSLGQAVYPFVESTKRLALRPEDFQHRDTKQPVSKRDFMAALSNVSRLHLRATYCDDDAAIYR